MKLKLLSCIGVGLLLSLAVAGEGTGRHEASWSVMHPTAIDTNYMARVVGKAVSGGIALPAAGRMYLKTSLSREKVKAAFAAAKARDK